MSASPAAYTPPVDQPPPPAGSPYGGFWARFAAHVVDGIIISIVGAALAIAWVIVAGSAFAEFAGLMPLVILALAQLYHAYFVSSGKMATPGKRLCGLYVTDLEGRRLDFGKALLRNVAAALSYVTVYVGFIMTAFTARKQALHDMLVGTLVHRQPGSNVATVIVIVVALFLFIPVVGILAAVAIPAYQDYTYRAKMATVISTMTAARAPIQDYVVAKGAWPTTWDQAGSTNPMQQLPPESRALVEEIRLEQGGGIVASVKIFKSQGQLRMTPRKAGAALEWVCTSSQEIRKYVPASCRS